MSLMSFSSLAISDVLPDFESNLIVISFFLAFFTLHQR